MRGGGRFPHQPQPDPPHKLCFCQLLRQWCKVQPGSRGKEERAVLGAVRRCQPDLPYLVSSHLLTLLTALAHLITPSCHTKPDWGPLALCPHCFLALAIGLVLASPDLMDYQFTSAEQNRAVYLAPDTRQESTQNKCRVQEMTQSRINKNKKICRSCKGKCEKSASLS